MFSIPKVDLSFVLSESCQTTISLEFQLNFQVQQSFFLCFCRCQNHFQPANEQILIKPKLFRQVFFLVEPTKTDFCPKASKFTLIHFQFVFKLSNRHTQIFGRYLSQLQKLKVQFFPLKSARNCPPYKCPKVSKFAITKLVYSCRKSGQFVKDFSVTESVFFLFLLWLLTTEAMGTGGLRAYSLSHSDKVNAGAKPAKCTSASL